ncbi:MAG: BRO-N domain-containing protein [Candidatus Heimdallarchaeaceae archaeon]
MSIVARENFNGQPIALFEIEQKIWISANDVARALGYTNPRDAVYKIINRNMNDFIGHTCVDKLETQGQVREIRLLDEQGVYLFCMLAKTEKASQFRRWVAKILQIHRKNEQAFNKIISKNTPIEALEVLNQQLALVIQTFKEQQLQLEEQKRDIQYLKEITRSSSIDRFQRKKIKEKIDIIARLCHETTKEEYKFLYPRIWNWFKNTYNITSYEDLPKSLFNDAIQTLNAKIIELGGFVPEGVER